MKERESRKWRRPVRSEVHEVVRPLVLYVEDNRLNRLVMSKALSVGYEVLLATNDREACDLLRAHRDRLYYILMDIELQGSILNGIQLARLVNGQPVDLQLPEYARDVPILRTPLLFVTAYGDKCDFMVFDLESVVGVLHKPIDYKELRRRLAAAR